MTLPLSLPGHPSRSIHIHFKVAYLPSRNNQDCCCHLSIPREISLDPLPKNLLPDTVLGFFRLFRLPRSPSEFDALSSLNFSSTMCPQWNVTCGLKDLRNARVQLQQPGIQPEGVSGVGKRNEAVSQFSWTACLFQAYDSLSYFYKSIRSEVWYF